MLRRARIPFALVVAATAVALVWIIPRKGVLPLSWAFGRGADRTMLPALALILVGALAPLAYRFVRGAAPTWQRLLVTFAAGIALCHALVLAEGRGIEPLRDTLWRSGHAEFLRIARDQQLEGLVGRYEELAAERKWTFPRSKPPGCLAFYRGITWLGDSQLGVGLGRLWAPSAPQIGRDERIAGVALTLFPVLTFATIFPLWGLVRLLAGSHEADLSTLLYAVTPSVLLVTNHLDAAVYPLCAVTSAALALWGTRERRPWATFAGGAVLSAGIFVSFSLLPVVALAGLLPLCDSLIAARAGDSLRRRALRGVGHGAVFAAGLVAVHAPLVLALHYDLVARFRDAALFHAQWWSNLEPWIVGNPIQFFLWVGVPTTLAFFVRAVRADWSQTAFVVLATLLLLTVTNALGDARAESQRLWLLFVPFVCAGAAPTLARWEDEGGDRVVPVFLALEIATAFLLKINYTF
ncbi:MAG TPA: hypothetical protein VKE22_20575 [Haliangiales bacterium]|nr:hypothetical protein [Haliangiales bacterium]